MFVFHGKLNEMRVIEDIIAFLAPHYCIACGQEGAVVCDWCLPDFATPLPERCYRCKAMARDSRVCGKCRKASCLKHVWARTEYDALPKRLVHDFKFERKKAAAAPIARLMGERLPYLPQETIVAHIPTATSRVRRRGYDPAELIASVLAQELGLRHETLLRRVTQTRQVGAKRAERLKQMEHAFRSVNTDGIKGATVLLIDDLTTTGSTLEAAARSLKDAGATSVSAAVFAQK